MFHREYKGNSGNISVKLPVICILQKSDEKVHHMNPEIKEKPEEKIWLIFFAWFSILMISDLPDIIWKYVSGVVPVWMFWGKTGFLVIFLIICLFFQKLRTLLPYAFVMLVFYIALSVSELIRTSGWWIGLISNKAQTSFALMYIKPFIRDIGVTIVVICALWIIKKRRADFFLVTGEIDAPIEPVRWLGIRKKEPWRKFAWIFGIIAAIAVAVPTIIGLHPSAAILKKCIPLIPAAILFAAINAFNEELYFRATLFSTLVKVVGKSNTMLINIVFFGLAHFLYGSPPGVIGFMMTGFLAFLMGKSMLETKGFLLPWLIHFLPDVIIFISNAIVWMS